eukprot:5874692-Heterocapsa_arctica.AAC.1
MASWFALDDPSPASEYGVFFDEDLGREVPVAPDQIHQTSSELRRLLGAWGFWFTTSFAIKRTSLIWVLSYT